MTDLPASISAAPGAMTVRRPGGMVVGVHGLRGLAALAIVLYHSGGSIGAEKYQNITAVAHYTHGLATGVDLFFVISGFVISLPVFLGRRIPMEQYVLHRLLRIYPLAMLTALIFLVSNWLIYARPPALPSVLSSVFLLPSRGDPTPIVLWTLKQELLFYAVFALVLFHRAAGFALVALWGIASVSLLKAGMVSGIYAEWLFHPQNVQFLFGILAAWAFVARPAPRPLALSLTAGGLAAFVALSYWPILNAPTPGRPIVLLGAIGSAVVFGAASANMALPAVLIFLGTASYSLYLIHFFFVSMGNKLLFTALPNIPGSVALVLLATFATGGGSIYYALVERHLEIWRKSLRRRACPS